MRILALKSSTAVASCQLFLPRALAAAGADEKKASGVKEYIDIYGDLRSRCVGL